MVEERTKNVKMMRRYITIAFSALLITSTVTAQEKKSAKAEKKYEMYSYDLAVEKLEAIESKTLDDKRKLAYSYLRTNDLAQAENYFQQVVTSPEKKASDVLSYAEVLQMNKKYEVAQQQMEVFSRLKPEDSRGKNYAGQSGYEAELMMDDGQFTVKNLDVNTAHEDFGPSYYGDKVVFASSRKGPGPVKRTWNWNRLPFLDIYEAKPSEDLELSSVSTHNEKQNKKYHEGPTAFSADGQIKVFTRNNYSGTDSKGVRRLKMFESTKKDIGWTSPIGMSWNNDEYSSGHATLTADGNTMYFASDMPGGVGGVDIYRSDKSGGAWGTPQNLGPEINTEGDEMFPYIHETGLLLFASNGHVGLGGLDVFRTQISEDNAPKKIINLGAPINTNRDDFGMIIDKEMTTGYLSSNRPGGKGDDDIYSFKMLKPFKMGAVIEGIAMDKKGVPLPGATINLYDSEGNQLESVQADDEGYYEFIVDPEKEFGLNGSKPDYFEGMNTASTVDATGPVKADLVLEKDPGLSLYGLVSDAKTNGPLEGVKVTIEDNLSDEVQNFTTPTSGDFRDALSGKKISDRISYNLTLEKEGYLTKRVTYNALIDRPGQYDVHNNMDLSLVKLEVGMDIGKAININPIYFDLNKFNIRPDAQVELQKIVDVMNEYPSMEIELGSHTDCRASDAYNQSLSEKRAKASAAWVRNHIASPQRIYGKGYGESQLVNHCACDRKDPGNKICSEEEHQLNRRTEFRIVKM